MRNNIILSLTFLFVTLSLVLNAQLQSPSQFLPYEHGDKFTPHHLLVDYFQHVAKQSDHIIYKEYGKTNEDRPLIYTIISSNENLRNLEKIRTDNLKRTGLLEGSPKSEKPISIVWLSHGVHGNEASASETSMATLFALAQKDNKEVQSWLEDVVVILDPCINPDGYSRYTHWNRSVSNSIININPESREHSEPWPGGRTNHYLFDLNRDWAWHTQVESQQRLEVYHDWMPHVHVDFHEMGHNDPYYFAPAAQPYHQYISDWQSEFQMKVGKNHAKYFDKEGWFYFTKEVFDLFYPSYGDTYPIFNGSVGMTYEQGGGPRGGRAIIMNNEDTLTLHDRIAHHLTTGLSTIEASAKNAKELTENFEKYFSDSKASPLGKYKTFIIRSNNPQSKLKRLAQFLDKHKIEYGTAKSGTSLEAYDYSNARSKNIKLNDRDLIISAHQPLSVLTQVLFEPDHFLIDSLTYDITAWALPHAMGLETFASTEKISVDNGYDFGKFSSNVKGKENAYAYLIEWDALNSAKCLSELHQQNVKVRYATEPFQIEGKNYKSGTLIIGRADNRKQEKQLRSIVEKISTQLEQTVYPVNSGFTLTGPNFGSDKMRLIDKPKVICLAGDRVSSYSFGQIWHYFETDLKFPFSVWSTSDLDRRNLDEYNTLILPEGYYSLKKSTIEKISGWANQGGKVIAVGGAVSKLEDQPGFKLKRFAKDSDKAKEKVEAEKERLDHRLDTYHHRERRSIAGAMPGAIFKLRMDNSHPLAFGMPEYYFTLKTSTRKYDFLKDVWNVGYIGEKPLIHGFVGYKVKKKMKNNTVFAVQRKGRGSVIYLIDNPLYRGFWEQGKFLFSNALFF